MAFMAPLLPMLGMGVAETALGTGLAATAAAATGFMPAAAGLAASAGTGAAAAAGVGLGTTLLETAMIGSTLLSVLPMLQKAPKYIDAPRETLSAKAESSIIAKGQKAIAAGYTPAATTALGQPLGGN